MQNVWYRSDHRGHYNPGLTVIDPVTKVTFPAPLVQKRHKGIDVRPTRPAAHDGVGRDHRQLLRERAKVMRIMILRFSFNALLDIYLFSI